jgi:hypothetical protein
MGVYQLTSTVASGFPLAPEADTVPLTLNFFWHGQILPIEGFRVGRGSIFGVLGSECVQGFVQCE